jgi:short-subunit dehydrogenase
MQTALITGASLGIGAAFAQELAARQTNLILVARSEDKLQQQAENLQTKFGIQVKVIVQDLTQLDASSQIFELVKGEAIDLLVNNAGIGDYGPFAERSLERQSAIVKLNILALVEMTHLFLPGMQQRGSGGIINLSSISAFQSIPYLAAYAASKAFVLHFSEALWAENKAKGVQVMALCPGPIHTGFFAQAEMEGNTRLMARQSYEDPEDVVKKALKALAEGRSNLVTGGLRNHAIVNANRLAPRELLVRALEKEFRPRVP